MLRNLEKQFLAKFEILKSNVLNIRFLLSICEQQSMGGYVCSPKAMLKLLVSMHWHPLFFSFLFLIPLAQPYVWIFVPLLASLFICLTGACFCLTIFILVEIQELRIFFLFICVLPSSTYMEFLIIVTHTHTAIEEEETSSLIEILKKWIWLFGQWLAGGRVGMHTYKLDHRNAWVRDVVVVI